MDVIIANDNRDNLFAEISYQLVNEGRDLISAVTFIPWAEVIYDDALGKFMLTIRSLPDGKTHPAFDLVEAQEALNRAKQRLIDRGYGNLNSIEPAKEHIATTKYLLAALLYLLIGSVGLALYHTVLAWTEWRIVSFVIGYMGIIGGLSMLILWLLSMKKPK